VFGPVRGWIFAAGYNTVLQGPLDPKVRTLSRARACARLNAIMFKRLVG
jgi:hypothetical protein